MIKNVYGQLANQSELLEHGAGDLAGLDCFQCFHSTIKTYDHDVRTVGGFQRLSDAQAHFVILSIDQIDVGIGLQDVLDGVEGGGTVEVGALLRDDFDLSSSDGILEAREALILQIGSQRAAQNDHLALTFKLLHGEFTRCFASGIVVSGNGGDNFTGGS